MPRFRVYLSIFAVHAHVFLNSPVYMATFEGQRSVFIPIPKKANAKECSNYHTVALISHPSKLMLKILQDRLQQYENPEF